LVKVNFWICLSQILHIFHESIFYNLLHSHFLRSFLVNLQ